MTFIHNTKEPTMGALEQSFADLCDKHDLTSLSVCFIKCSVGDFFSASAQNAPHAGHAHGATIKVAIGCAIADLNSKRRTAEPVALADERLVA